MKRLFSVVLFCVLVAPFVLPYALMSYEKFQLKKTVKRQLLSGINKTELTCLKFSKEEIETVLKWEHSKEFEFQHKMYDVVYATSYSDSVMYWCWEDHAETVLEIELKSHIADALGASPNHEKNKHTLSEFFKQVYFSNVLKWNHFLTVVQLNYIQFSVDELVGCFSSLVLPPENIKQM